MEKGFIEMTDEEQRSLLILLMRIYRMPPESKAFLRCYIHLTPAEQDAAFAEYLATHDSGEQ